MSNKNTDLDFININSEYKKQAETVLNKLNIDLSEAVSLFLKEIALKNDIPFDITQQNLNKLNNDFSLLKQNSNFNNIDTFKSNKIIQLFRNGDIDYDVAEYALNKIVSNNNLNINLETQERKLLQIATLESIFYSGHLNLIRLEGANEDFKITYINNNAVKYNDNISLAEIQMLFDNNGLPIGLLDKDSDNVKNLNNSLEVVGQTNIIESKFEFENELHWIRIVSTLIGYNDNKKIIQEMIIDITEEKELLYEYDQLRQKKYYDEIFSIITQNSSTAYFLFSPTDFTTEYVTSNIERLTGIKQEDIYKYGMDFIRPEGWDPKDSRASVMDIKEGESVTFERTRTHKKTNEVRYFEDTFYIAKINDIKKGVLVMSDVTKMKTDSEILNQALEDAKKANATKSEFLANMSHDIRTPMNAIIGIIALLQKQGRFYRKNKELINKLEITSQAMLDIINNVLDMSRIESGKLYLNNAPFKMDDIMKEINAIFSITASHRNIDFRFNIDIKYNEHYGDYVAIKKIINNIISNAIKYTPDKGKVRVNLLSIGLDEDNKDVIMFVCEDTGVGMSSDFLRKMFRPFEREKDTKISKEAGTGLGMAITKNIVELLGGTINIDSKKDVGTKVIVTIPLKPVLDSKSNKQEETEKENKQTIEGLKILVAEDNDLNAEIIMELLSLEGAECIRAIDGKCALDIFNESSIDDFDVILMDIQMPIMNGFESTKAIRRSNHPKAKSIPIIAMTANVFQEDINNSLNAGMNAHTSKPINIDIVKKIINDLI